MTKSKAKFAPQIYTAWNDIFKNLPVEERSEVLLGISGYPDYKVENVKMWDFIKNELAGQYERFEERRGKNAKISRNYWDVHRKDISNDNQSISNDIHNYNNNHNYNIKPEQENIIITESEQDAIQEYAGSNKVVITEDFRFEELFPEYAEYKELCDNLNEWFRKQQKGKTWYIKGIQEQAQNFINRNPDLFK